MTRPSVRRFTSHVILILLTTSAALFGGETRSEESRSESQFQKAPPNVLVILADDLGYSDLGCYGSEIATPHLNSLAEGGLRFTSFYNTARCWPTRSALLTGYYPQQIRRDALPDVPGGGGNRFRRPQWAPLLPQVLKPAGYRSYYSGKWHIDGTPEEGGFDRSYELADQGRFFRPKRHLENGKALPAVTDADGYYSTVAIADHAIKVLKDHSVSHSSQPFFQYVAFTAPHFPLQALPEDIKKYAARYKEGWELLRLQRWERQKQLNFPGGMLSATERDLGPPYPFPKDIAKLGPGEVILPLPWDQLTAEQQQFQAGKMAIHAAMVDRMDQEIGRILEQLRQMNAFDNTLILFLSDNGASAEIMVRDDGHDLSAPLGSAATHLCLGPGWSTVCNTPFRRHKTWVHEGGISTPLIAHWPAGIAARGEFQADAGHVIDVVPTVLELAGIKPPAEWNGVAVPVSPGRSLLPLLSQSSSEGDAAAPLHDAIWWLHEGHRALRMGTWKIVAANNEPWALYDLSKDRAEQNDLVTQQPDRLKLMQAEWERMTAEFAAQMKQQQADEKQ